MESGNSNQHKEKGKSRDRRVWTKAEEKALIEILEELVVTGWRCDNGIFKNGSTCLIQKKLEMKCPGCNLKANPHIESKMKVLKKHYNLVTDMLGQFGFGWNEQLKCVQVDSDDIWEKYLKREPKAKCFRNKPFPIYEKLGYIFGKNRAIDKGVEAPVDAVEELNAEEVANVGLDDINTSTSVSQPSSVKPDSQQPCRKRNRDTDAFSSALKDLGSMFVEVLDVVVERIGQRNTLSNDRRKVMDELMKMEHLTPRNRIIIARKIVERPDYVDLFLCSSDMYKEELVAVLLEESAS